MQPVQDDSEGGVVAVTDTVKRPPRWLWRTLLVVTLLPLLLLLGLYLGLQQPAFNSWLLRMGADSLQTEAGVEVVAEGEIRIDLLRGIQLKGIAVVWRHPQLGMMKARLDALSLQYSLDQILDRTITVQRLHLGPLQLQGRLTLADSTAAPSNATTNTDLDADALWAEIEPLVMGSALMLQLEDLQITDLTLDVALIQPSQQLHYRGRLGVEGRVEWVAGALRGETQLQIEPYLPVGGLGDETTLRLTDAAGVESTISLRPLLTSHLQWGLSRQQGGWRLEGSQLQQLLNLDGLHLSYGAVSQGAATTAADPISQRASITLPRLQIAFNTQLVSAPRSVASLSTSAVDAPWSTLFPLEQESQLTADIELAAQLDGPIRLDTQIDYTLNWGHQQQLLHNAPWLGAFESSAKQQLVIEQLSLAHEGRQLQLQQLVLEHQSQLSLPAAGEALTLFSRLQLGGDTVTLSQSASQPEEGVAGGGPAITLGLQPSMQLQLDGQITAFTLGLDQQQLAQQLQLELTQQLELRQLALHYPEHPISSSKPQLFRLQGSYAQEQLDLDVGLELQALEQPQWQRPLSLSQQLTLQSDRYLSYLTSSMETRINSKPLLLVALERDTPSQPYHLSLRPSLHLYPLEGLSDYYPAAALLDDLGRPELTLTTLIDMTLPTAALLEADLALMPQWPVTLQGELTLSQHQPPRADFPYLRQPLNIQFDLDKGEWLQLGLQLSAPSLFMGPLRRPIAVELALEQRVNWPLNSRLQATGAVVIDGRPHLDYQLTLHDRAATLHYSTQIRLAADPSMQLYLQPLQQLEQLGSIQLDAKMNGSLRYALAPDNATPQQPTPSILSVDPTHAMSWPTQLQADLVLTQQRAGESALLQLSRPLKLQLTIDKAARLAADLQLSAAEFSTPQLARTMALSLHHHSETPWPPVKTGHSEAEGQLQIDGLPLLGYQLHLDDQPGRLELKGGLELVSEPQLATLSPTLAMLTQIGAGELSLQLTTTLHHPEEGMFSMSPELFSAPSAQVRLQMGLDSRYRQDPLRRGTLFELSQPLSVATQLQWQASELTLSGHISAPAVAQPGVVETQGLQLGIEATVTPGPTATRLPEQVQLQLRLQPADISVIPQQDSAHEEPVSVAPAQPLLPLAVGHLLTPLQLDLAVHRQGAAIELQQLYMDMGLGLLGLQASGEGNSDHRSGQLELLLESTLRAGLLSQPPLAGSGQLKLPLQITVVEGSQLSLEGGLELSQLGLKGEGWGISGANGYIGFSEEVRLNDSGELVFHYLLHKDPFQRVDYGRVEPYLSVHQPLTIDRLGYQQLAIGPLSAYLDLQQNLFHLQQLELDLLNGHLSGQLYLDTQPGGWQAGFMGRVTDIDLAPLLSSGSVLDRREEAPLTARIALNFDINKLLLEGRVDLQRISRQQLLQLLELMDPEYQDEQLAQLRALLRLAYPEWVAINMQRGLMDLEVSISTLPSTMRLTGLPLSPLLQKFLAAPIEQLQQLPIPQ